MNAEWRPIDGFPEYAVSNDGRVRRVVPDARNHQCRDLIPYIANHGYQTVGLWRNMKSHRRLVHRLVCAAFHGPAPFEDAQVAHNDGSRLNNHADNLRWATRSENVEDTRRHGVMPIGTRHGRTTKPERTPRGEKHGHAKITEHMVKAIRAEPRWAGSGRALARRYGISPSTVCIIRSGKIWKHVS